MIVILKKYILATMAVLAVLIIGFSVKTKAAAIADATYFVAELRNEYFQEKINFCLAMQCDEVFNCISGLQASGWSENNKQNSSRALNAKIQSCNKKTQKNSRPLRGGQLQEGGDSEQQPHAEAPPSVTPPTEQAQPKSDCYSFTVTPHCPQIGSSDLLYYKYFKKRFS